MRLNQMMFRHPIFWSHFPQNMFSLLACPAWSLALQDLIYGLWPFTATSSLTSRSLPTSVSVSATLWKLFLHKQNEQIPLKSYHQVILCSTQPMLNFQLLKLYPSRMLIHQPDTQLIQSLLSPHPSFPHTQVRQEMEPQDTGWEARGSIL